MDPTETLRRIRAHVRAFEEGQLDDDQVGALVDLIEALDQWIAGGGAPPAPWAKAHTAAMLAAAPGRSGARRPPAR
jgi:hypothetical protein